MPGWDMRTFIIKPRRKWFWYGPFTLLYTRHRGLSHWDQYSHSGQLEGMKLCLYIPYTPSLRVA